ncbi:hypothetical protein AHAS_Ahas16G0188400 [Arachis hypogaea]
MDTKKEKEKFTDKTPARRGTKRTLAKAPPSTSVKPPTKRVKRIIKVDESEKAFPARDSTLFTNHYCEQMFLILAERNYNNEYLLIVPTHVVDFLEPRIERRQWGFLRRQPREANLSWVVMFYSNFHSPTLQTVFVRQQQVPVSDSAIQRALDLPPSPEGWDVYQKASSKHQTYQFG